MCPGAAPPSARTYRGRVTWLVRWDELPLARSSVDRSAHRRGEEGLLERLLAEDSSRVLLSHRGRVAVVRATGDAALDLRSPREPLVALALSTEGAERFFLGTDAEASYLALVLPEDAELPPGTDWANLREVGEHLDARDAGLATTTVALAAWHGTHRFCPRCGSATSPSFAGWQRSCPREGTELYPRTDPAVIMAVTDGEDRLLLGHARHWPERRFSTLAGFVEAGESAEQAVRREVLEEVSLPVGEVEYRGSQSWPFPASLMLAFRARVTATQIQVDGVELGEARWFDRPALQAAAQSGEVLLPGRASIARALVEDWFGGTLP